jgi:hypothetical protein
MGLLSSEQREHIDFGPTHAADRTLRMQVPHT